MLASPSYSRAVPMSMLHIQSWLEQDCARFISLLLLDDNLNFTAQPLNNPPIMTYNNDLCSVLSVSKGSSSFTLP